MRLQRFLAQAGVASRRKAEELIVAGRVRVNGRTVSELGSKVDPRRDTITVDERPVEPERPVYVMLHKPRGYVTTLSDPEGRPTVMDLVKVKGTRLYPVGRLDFNTEGILLLTNDGDLAHRLMHPSRGVEKTYRVKLRGAVLPQAVEQLRRGVTLDDGERTAPAEARVVAPSEGGNNTWLEITVHEGKNRQIHRMAEAIGHQVAKLQRVQYGGLELGALKTGRWRTLEDKEVDQLRALAELPRIRRPKVSRPVPAAARGRSSSRSSGRSRAPAPGPKRGSPPPAKRASAPPAKRGERKGR